MITTHLVETELNGQKIYKTYANIANLKRDENNPKDISDEKHADLCDFLDEYDQLMPLLIDARPEKEGQLLGGNHTLEALKEIGKTEAWVEFRTPESDAEAFMIATVHNQQFAHYLESKLKAQLEKYKTDLGDTLSKLEAQITPPESFEELLKRFSGNTANKPMKYEIIIRCADESDLMEKMNKIGSLGIAAKKRGK